jgi:hypothetical protein
MCDKLYVTPCCLSLYKTVFTVKSLSGAWLGVYRIVRPLRAAQSKEWQNEHLKRNKLVFLHLTNFKL